MSKTWFGHHIENIKGDDYVLFTDYVELEQKIDNLQQELGQYKNNWEELKKCIEENKINISLNPYSKYAITIELVLNKMKELEEGK